MARRKNASQLIKPSRKRWHVPPGQRDTWPIEPPPRKTKQAQESNDAGNAKSRD